LYIDYISQALVSDASLFASTVTRAVSTQPFVVGQQRSSGGRRTTSDNLFIAATAATVAAVSAGVGGHIVNCEREGVVRDPKTPYGLHAENVLKMELKRRMTELQMEEGEEVKAPSTTTILEPLLLEDKEEVSASLPKPTTTSTKEANDSSASIINATSPAAAAPSASSPSDPAAEPSTLMTPEEARLEAATLKAKKHGGGLKLFSGNGNMGLSLEIAKLLGVNLGRATVSSFADGEINVMIHENVRGKDVYIIQPTCTPVNNNLMELLLMVSCLNRASARRVTVVIPYYGYARQDRKMAARVPISAADVARLLESMGVDRVIAVDLHCGQIQGFFGPRVPVDNLEGGIVGVDHFGGKDLHNPVIVSPDAGGVYRAKKFKELLAYKYGWEDIGIAMIIKQRARAGSVDQMDLVGDVQDCDCIIVDGMIDTAGTLCKAADVLKDQGARRVFAFASHGLLSGPGNERIANSSLEECVILNTIPSTPQRVANEKLVELSVAPLLAQTIFNIHAKRSISALFK
jgi:ribose-phosphate pyrophosphokinase